MLEDRGVAMVPQHQFGYGNLELTFAFEHAVPDNSLQILHKRAANWVPLFNR